MRCMWLVPSISINDDLAAFCICKFVFVWFSVCKFVKVGKKNAFDSADENWNAWQFIGHQIDTLSICSSIFALYQNNWTKLVSLFSMWLNNPRKISQSLSFYLFISSCSRKKKMDQILNRITHIKWWKFLHFGCSKLLQYVQRCTCFNDKIIICFHLTFCNFAIYYEISLWYYAYTQTCTQCEFVAFGNVSKKTIHVRMYFNV